MSIFDTNILESASELLNKGADKVSGAIDNASTKVKQSELQRKREEACAALGAAVFAATKENAAFRIDYEELYAAVEAVDAKIAQVEAAIAAAEAEKAAKEAAAAAAKAAKENVCINCGAPLGEGALFCGNCGTKIPEPAPEPEVELLCPACGDVVPSDAAFCPSCGSKL